MTRQLFKLSEQFRCVALSELPLDEAADAQHKALGRFGPVITKPLDSWRDAFDRLQPLGTFPRNYIVAGLGDWSLVLCDMIGEPCLADVLFHSRLFGCRAVGGVALPAERRFFSIEKGEVLRDIQCFREDRWFFSSRGEPLGIERLESYRHRSPSERLPEHLVFDYVAAVAGVAFPLCFKSHPVRIIAFERSWNRLRQAPEEIEVTNDLGICGEA